MTSSNKLDDLFWTPPAPVLQHNAELYVPPTPSLVDAFGKPFTNESLITSDQAPVWFDPLIYVPPQNRPEAPMPKEADEYAKYAGPQAPSFLKLLNGPSTIMPAHVIKLWQAKPKIFFRDAMDVTLDLWQEEATELYVTHARLALLASKGPGKTSLLAMMCWHFFLCYYRPKIACMSISEAHLKSNLWAELLMWRSKSKLLQASANDGLTRITLKGHEGYSFIDARSYPKSADESAMAASLAGLHNDNVAFFIDEGGSIPDAIYNTADAALSGGDSARKRARLVTTGNPEKPEGTIYRAYKESLKEPKDRDPEMPEWAVYRVTGDPLDPKRAPRVDIKWAQSQIKLYGRDNPWVKVNVLCEYPDVASDKLLTEEEVDAAMNRTMEEREVVRAQVRLGVDVARGGIDDSALVRRRGLKVYHLQMEPSSLNGPELAGKIQFIVKEKKVERVFIDNTGGYGGSVIDNLNLGTRYVHVTPVVYNANAQDKDRYANRRAEMYVRMRDWIKNGGCLPKDNKLKEELLAPDIWFLGNKFQLEDKAQIKIKLGRSPDRADALAQTFCDVEEEGEQAGYQDDPYGWQRPAQGHVSDPYSQSASDYSSQHNSGYHHS